MNPNDHPNLTAYVLGELEGADARALQGSVSSDAGTAHELEQIETVTDALRHTAPIPTARLTLEQRQAVLHPAHLPRLVQPMMPRKAPAPRPQSRPVFWSVVTGVLKAAALIALTGAAFFLGRNMPDAPVTAAVDEKAAQTGNAEKAPDVTPKPQTAPKVEIAEKAAKPAETPQMVPAPEKPVQTPKAVLVAAKPEIIVKEVVKPAAPMPDLGFTMKLDQFASTTKNASGQFSLQPALIKAPAPPQDPTALASPAKQPAKATPVTKSPELLIHSWKSEVADCPWNSAHRLLRIVIQLPANQSAVTSLKDASYPISIGFDPLHVKQYRLLSERHLPAASLDSAGTQIIWYEFQPNGTTEINSQTGRQIASVSVFGARFTTQAVGPFDSSKLQVLDRGFTLQNAREDFLFESAVVGFGLLMRGSEGTGSLNHEMVLDLARRGTKTTADQPPAPERARFIRLVQDAQRVIGG